MAQITLSLNLFIKLECHITTIITEKRNHFGFDFKTNQHGFWMCIYYWCTPMAKPTKSSYCNVACPCIARSLVRKPSIRGRKNVLTIILAQLKMDQRSLGNSMYIYRDIVRYAVTHFIFTCQTFDLYTSYDEVIQGKPSGAGVIFCKQVLNKCRSESVSHLLECCNM